jgi:hypothetical protein
MGLFLSVADYDLRGAVRGRETDEAANEAEASDERRATSDEQ